MDGFDAAEPTPLVAGSVRGLRRFEVCPTPMGWSLTGVAVRLPWCSGVNRARCYQDAMFSRRDMAVMAPESLPPADMGTDCSCGFYAYTSTEGVGPSHGVLGVIEGWGGCVLGDQGFRAEYARIAGVVLPRRRAHWRIGMCWRVPGVSSGTDRLRWVFLAAVLVVLAANLVDLVSGSWGAAVALPFLLLTWVSMFYGFSPDRLARDLAEHPRVLPEEARAVRRAYPGVPVFRSRSELLAAFPLGAVGPRVQNDNRRDHDAGVRVSGGSAGGPAAGR